MTTQETQAALGFIKTAYPSFGGENRPEDVAALWARMFAADSPEVVMAAVERYIQIGKYPPTVVDIRGIITDMTMPTVTPGEIWDEVHRLCNSGIAVDDSATAYSRMTDVCKEATLAVGGWYALSMSEDGDPHIRRTFLQAAQARLQRDRAQGIPFDRSRMNTLVPRGVAPWLTEDAHG